MSTDSFFSRFDTDNSLSPAEKSLLTARMLERRIKRRQCILQEEDVCRCYTFVVEGFFRLFQVDKRGNEHNLQFAGENDWITELSSFYSGNPSHVYIEAIEPSIIFQIKKSDLLLLFDLSPKIERKFRILVEKRYMELEYRMLQAISMTAQERYTTFIHKHPALYSKLPTKEIASYLGITPEFLSRVRKDILRK